MEFNNLQFDMPKQRSSTIKVIGVGGGGSNAVDHMYKQGITGVDFVVSNTDVQALNNSAVPNKVQLGITIAEGLGAGAIPEKGEQSALESADDIKKLLETNTKMVFITAGMGGGTGTGAAPIIAGIAKEMGILTVGICTFPFYFEGDTKIKNAHKGIEKFRENVDTLIIIKNDKLRELYGNMSFKSALAKADEVLTTAAKGIAEVITHYYSINIDLRDARTVLADSGTAIMGSAKAEGENKAKKAIELALDSPLLNDNKISGARNVLLLIVSGDDEVTMDEIGLINEYIQREAGNKANIIMGIGEDDSLGKNMSVTVIATGFPADQHMNITTKKEPIIHFLKTEDKITPETLQINTKSNLKKENIADEIHIADDNEEIQSKIDETVENNESYDFKLKTLNNDNNESTNDSFDPLNKSIKEINKELNKELNKKITEDNTLENKTEKLTLFTLDDFEEEIERPIISKKTNTQIKESIKPIENNISSTHEKPETTKAIENDEVDESKITNPFESPIKESTNDEINERRARLKKFSHKFNSYVKNSNENDDIPSFEKAKIKLHEHKKDEEGSYIIDTDISGNIKIRPNDFLNKTRD